MKSSRPRDRTKSVSLRMQGFHIRRLFPGFVSAGDNKRMSWTGSLQPTPNSPTYTVRISYSSTGVPKVKVLNPAIRSDAPHLYRSGHLCLYFPDDAPWLGDELIAQTIIPWAASWLYFYELWLDTGRWLGPEAPHDVNKKVG